jgi:hypothetical protein
MSADGSWSVCTHEHLHTSLFSFDSALAKSCQQMVHGVFALMNICYITLSALASAKQVSDGSWSVCTHEHLKHRCSSAMRLPVKISCQQMVHGVFALMNICRHRFFWRACFK